MNGLCSRPFNNSVLSLLSCCCCVKQMPQQSCISTGEMRKEQHRLSPEIKPQTPDKVSRTFLQRGTVSCSLTMSLLTHRKAQFGHQTGMLVRMGVDRATLSLCVSADHRLCQLVCTRERAAIGFLLTSAAVEKPCCSRGP